MTGFDVRLAHDTGAGSEPASLVGQRPAAAGPAHHAGDAGRAQQFVPEQFGGGPHRMALRLLRDHDAAVAADAQGKGVGYATDSDVGDHHCLSAEHLHLGCREIEFRKPSRAGIEQRLHHPAAGAGVAQAGGELTTVVPDPGNVNRVRAGDRYPRGIQIDKVEIHRGRHHAAALQIPHQDRELGARLGRVSRRHSRRGRRRFGVAHRGGGGGCIRGFRIGHRRGRRGFRVGYRCGGRHASAAATCWAAVGGRVTRRIPVTSSRLPPV